MQKKVMYDQISLQLFDDQASRLEEKCKIIIDKFLPFKDVNNEELRLKREKFLNSLLEEYLKTNKIGHFWKVYERLQDGVTWEDILKEF